MSDDLTQKEITTGQRLFCDLKRSRAAFDAHCYEVYERTLRPHRVIAEAFGCGHSTVTDAIGRERDRRGGKLVERRPAFAEARQPETQRKALDREATRREQRKAEKASTKQNKRIDDRLREIARSARSLNSMLDKAMELAQGDPALVEECLNSIAHLVTTFEAVSSYMLRQKGAKQ